MGKAFGNMTVARRLVYYGISPSEIKPFAGAISQGIPNLFRRFRGQALRTIPFFVLTYMVYDWGETQNALTARKNPADYENDE